LAAKILPERRAAMVSIVPQVRISTSMRIMSAARRSGGAWPARW
jgi:hypothetical protein